MAENNWLLNDSGPVPLAQEFAAAQAEAAWGWFGLPAAGEGSEFAAAATPWAYDFHPSPDLYLFTAEVGGGTIHDGAAALSAEGIVAAAASRILAGVGAVSGEGVVAAVASRLLGGGAALAGDGVVAAAASRILGGQLVVVGDGVVAAAAIRTLAGLAALLGEGTLLATGSVPATHLGQAVLSGEGLVVAVGDVDTPVPPDPLKGRYSIPAGYRRLR